MPSLRRSLAYIGNFGPAHSTENHVAETLEDLEYRVHRLQEIGAGAVDAARVLEVVERERCELLLWTRTMPGLRGDAHGMLRQLRERGVTTVAYHLDLYAGLERAGDVDAHPWWRCDHVFTPDGGHDEFWAAHKINHHWLPPGVLRRECYTADARADLLTDVLFVGSYRYHPEWPYRRKLIDWLRATYGSRFALRGAGPPEGDGRSWRGDELNQLYASAKVVVGDSLLLAGAASRYWSDRLYETIGRGGFLVFPRVDGVELVDGQHYVAYELGDFADLRAKIDHYAQSDARAAGTRHRISRDGQAFVRERCSYHERVRAVLEAVYDPSKERLFS